MVYDDAEKLYGEVRKDGDALLEEAFDVLFPDSVPLTPETPLQSADDLVAFNTTFFPRRAIVKVPLGLRLAPDYRSKIAQTSMNGTFGYTVVDCPGGGSPGSTVNVSNNCNIDYYPVSGAFCINRVCPLRLILKQFGAMEETTPFFGIPLSSSRFPTAGSPACLMLGSSTLSVVEYTGELTLTASHIIGGNSFLRAHLAVW
jgi:hypothetical protein